MVIQHSIVYFLMETTTSLMDTTKRFLALIQSQLSGASYVSFHEQWTISPFSCTRTSWDIFLVETQSAVRSRDNKKVSNPKDFQRGGFEVYLSYRPPVPPSHLENSFILCKRHANLRYWISSFLIFHLLPSAEWMRYHCSQPSHSDGFAPSALLGNAGCHFLPSALWQSLWVSLYQIQNLVRSDVIRRHSRA